MITIQDELKELFRDDSVPKRCTISFPNGEHPIINDNITTSIFSSHIISETVEFTESICSSDKLTFGQFESSVFKFSCFGVVDIKGCIIQPSIDVYYEPWDGWVGINVGRFIVDSCKRDSKDLTKRDVIAYSQVNLDTMVDTSFEAWKLSTYMPAANWDIEMDYVVLSILFNNTYNALSLYNFSRQWITPYDTDSATLYTNDQRLAPTILIDDLEFGITFVCESLGYASITGRTSGDKNEHFQEELLYQTIQIDSSTFNNKVTTIYNSIFSALQSAGYTGYINQQKFSDKLQEIIKKYCFGCRITYDCTNRLTLDYYTTEDLLFYPKIADVNPTMHIVLPQTIKNIFIYIYRDRERIQRVSASTSLPITVNVSGFLSAYDSPTELLLPHLALRLISSVQDTKQKVGTTILAGDQPNQNLTTRGLYHKYDIDLKSLVVSYIELVGQFIVPRRDYLASGTKNAGVRIFGLFNRQVISSSEIEYNPVSISENLDSDDIQTLFYEDYAAGKYGGIKYKFNGFTRLYIFDPDLRTIIGTSDYESENVEFIPDTFIYDMTNNLILDLIDKCKDVWSINAGGEGETTVDEDVQNFLKRCFVPAVSFSEYMPMELTMRGLPYLQAGDRINIVTPQLMEFNNFIFRQTYKGIRSIVGDISTEGDSQGQETLEEEIFGICTEDGNPMITQDSNYLVTKY